jgi:hypothetical protein
MRILFLALFVPGSYVRVISVLFLKIYGDEACGVILEGSNFQVINFTKGIFKNAT